MIDIKLIRESPEVVKENIKKKFQEEKIPLLEKIMEIDAEWRKTKNKADMLRSKRNRISEEINGLLKAGEKIKAKEKIKEASKISKELDFVHEKEKELISKRDSLLLKIPNIIDESVPIGEDESKNVEIKRYGEPKVPDFEVLNHAEILEKTGTLDFESSRKTSGSGFYFLKGSLAELHMALLSYARDFITSKGYLLVLPPFMVREEIVRGVMSFEEMDQMMYKVENEDLYLIGTSEQSLIGMFKGKVIEKSKLPIKVTAYSPCFRKEKGAHGIEERGLYRLHQFEKQEMVVVCDPEESKKMYEEMIGLSVEFFLSLGIPIRRLESCSGDLGDLKSKGEDIEAWSPRQKKYFEVGSCSNMTSAQARRLGIKINGGHGNYTAHTLNNTVVASPRTIIAIVENYQERDGSIGIPEVLQRYMKGKKKIEPLK